jgi:ATP-dependent DNA ligase
MADRGTVPYPSDPREWLPMRPYRGRRAFAIHDPVLEPFWSGVRVIAHVVTPAHGGGPEVALIEDLGADVAAELPELREAIGASVMAVDAVIDGVISRQVGLDGVGAAAIPEMRGRSGLLIRNRAELDVLPRGGVGEPDEAREGFVAFDLLRVDGASVLAVPLLERKRLLESVVRPSELVRTSVHVRPPIETWLATWKSMGFRGGMLKAANSRYEPGSDTIEWRVVERFGRQG